MNHDDDDVRASTVTLTKYQTHLYKVAHLSILYTHTDCHQHRLHRAGTRLNREGRAALPCLSFIVPPDNKEPSCPSNSHYGSGSACELSCDNLNITVMTCTMQLKFGCFCDKGYVLKKSAEPSEHIICMRPDKCDVTCPPNMYFDPHGSKCFRSCNNGQEWCSSEVHPRCVCMETFLFSDDKNGCVASCPPPTMH
ncbi:uncharacterized protein O3C94_013324 isoform 1-T1 [Discoglossus pictus]